MTASQAKAAAEEAGLSIRTVGSGDTVTSQVPSYSATVSRSSTIVLYMGENAPDETVVVPDLTGLGVSQVRQKLSALGLYYKSSGSEYATGNIVAQRQDIKGGTEVPVGTVVSVEFTDLNQLAQ